jgi:hypothetical protein
MIKIPSVYPLPVATYPAPRDEGSTEETGTEKRRKTILENRTRYHSTKIIPIEQNNIGKRKQEEKKEWKTRRATNKSSLKVMVAR